MPKTISFHNGTTWSRGHNIRDERYTSKQEHIDSTLSEKNIIVRDVPVRQAYADIFQQAVEEYNAKQKRSDRCIADYYEKIKQDKKKYPVYECIVQIGDRSDTGNTAEPEKQALLRFAEEWDSRNPNLRLIGAYIHCDEPDGTVHMHLDYIPVAECNRGMKIQNSLDRALQQQGFKSENIHQTAQIEWQDREREALCHICRDLNIDAQRNQGIGKGRKSLTPQEYRRAKEEQKTQIEAELTPLKKELDEYKELKVSAVPVVCEKKKIPLSQKVIVSNESIEKLEKQAKAYRINQFEIESLRTRKTELDQREHSYIEREMVVKALETKTKEEQTKVQHNIKVVKQLYERQKNINQLLEQSEAKTSSLIGLNASLTAQLEESNDSIQALQKRLEKASEALKEVCESYANAVKAIGMLKYDKELNGYRANLNEKQSRLIDAVTNYGASWIKSKGYPEIAENMQKRIGISRGIQNELNELNPYYHSRGMSR